MVDPSADKTDRVVPVMAAQKASMTSNNTASNSVDPPKRRSTRSTARAQNNVFSDPDALRMECLEKLGLYAYPTRGDGMDDLDHYQESSLIDQLTRNITVANALTFVWIR